MHIYFSGIGGTGIGPLAHIAAQAGYDVSGSDKQPSLYIDYLQKHGVTDIHIGQSYEDIETVHAANPIDWYVYSSAVKMEQSEPEEFTFCKEHGIRMSQRDAFLSQFLRDTDLQLIAIAGTHGKTTTTAMVIWLFKALGLPLSYSVGAKLSFGDMGHYNTKSSYFAYEADEFDRNFLAFNPEISIITGIDWDHPDIYPTREIYEQAFEQFIEQSNHSVMWASDTHKLTLNESTITELYDTNPIIDRISLAGAVNRRNAFQVASALSGIAKKTIPELLTLLESFPGLSRRFEQLIPNLYTDYAHTPPKIQGALQMAHEVAGENVVVIYEGLHNTRHHFIREDLKTIFDDTFETIIVPSYLAREDPNLSLLSPEDLRQLLSVHAQNHTKTAQLDSDLQRTITEHLQHGKLVLCLTAGGGGRLDEWLRKTFL